MWFAIRPRHASPGAAAPRSRRRRLWCDFALASHGPASLSLVRQTTDPYGRHQTEFGGCFRGSTQQRRPRLDDDHRQDVAGLCFRDFPRTVCSRGALHSPEISARADHALRGVYQRILGSLRLAAHRQITRTNRPGRPAVHQLWSPRPGLDDRTTPRRNRGPPHPLGGRRDHPRATPGPRLCGRHFLAHAQYPKGDRIRFAPFEFDPG